MKTPDSILLNPRTCHKVAADGDIDAYVFAKSLATICKHPILINYKANANAYRLLLGLTDSKYRKLLNAAIRANFAFVEGDNLRLISISQEKIRYKARKRHYQLIKREDIKSFIYISVLKKNQSIQISAIRYKSRSAVNKACGPGDQKNEYSLLNYNKVNYNVTLSYRSAAKLLGLSLSNAFKQLDALKKFGLVINKNTRSISKDFYNYCKSIGNPCARYDKKNAKFYFVLPNSIKFGDFYNIKVAGTPFYMNDNW